MFTRLAILLPIFLFMGACASPPKWNADNGSRDLAVARVSHEYVGGSSEPELSDIQALELAQNRCNTWGYSTVEMIPGDLLDCSIEGEGTCALWKVTREYQCSAGGGNAHAASR